MDPIFEFPLDLPPRSSRLLLRTVHRQLKAAILDGRLQPGLRLPATRALATAYGMSRNTAVAAYDLLLSEGYLLTRPGAGTYVADVLPQLAVRKAHAGIAGAAPAPDRRLNAFWRDPPMLAQVSPPIPPRWDFRLGMSEHGKFPFDLWRRLSARALRVLSRTPVGYTEPQGRPALREAIARHVSFARAVACRPEDITVTAGTQQGFDLLARILVTSGKTVVAIEDPGYPPMRAAFSAAGARLVPVRVDQEGLMVDRLPPDARVICVTPSHQFPLGSVMSARRRGALLEFAQAHGAIVIEDDYDCEFRFGERPLDALQTLDRAESVFYVGTFSKSLFPAIRLGFVVAPLWAQHALAAAKQCADWHCPVLAQDTLAAFIEEGHLARHVRKMRQLYGARRLALLAGLQKDFNRWLEPVPSAAGLHLAALAKPSVNVDAIAKRAREQGIGACSLREYYFGKVVRPGLAFGYGAIEEPAIVEGLARLRRLF